MPRHFAATKKPVSNRGVAPDAFLDELVSIFLALDISLFAPNSEPEDVFSLIRPVLGPWTSLEHRRAAMCEVLRVLAGEESSWNWSEGVDTTNKTSMAHVEGQETGAWQVSADSMALSPALRSFIVERLGTDHPQAFIDAMKENHALAVEYVVRLLRVSYRWDGPISRGVVNSQVSRAACDEFQSLLAVG